MSLYHDSQTHQQQYTEQNLAQGLGVDRRLHHVLLLGGDKILRIHEEVIYHKRH